MVEVNPGRAIWAILYDLKESSHDDYMRWFHGLHIPEKLARDGYEWAGHYRIEKRVARSGAAARERSAGNDGSVLTGKQYIALFGGRSTATFLDPSPKQLKVLQDDETKQMIGCRVTPAGFVFAEEWRAMGRAAGDAQPPRVIELEVFDTGQDDEDTGVWCAQKRRAPFVADEGCILMQKLLASSGPAKHAALYGYDSLERAVEHTDVVARAIAQSPLADVTILPGNDAVFATRIWPPF